MDAIKKTFQSCKAQGRVCSSSPNFDSVCPSAGY